MTSNLVAPTPPQRRGRGAPGKDRSHQHGLVGSAEDAGHVRACATGSFARDYARIALQARVSQGLPERVEHLPTLERIARLFELRDPETKVDRAA